MKLLEKVKYGLIGSVITVLSISGFSFSDDIIETIQAKFYSIGISGNDKLINTVLLEYNDTLFVPIFDFADATGIKLNMNNDSNIVLSNYEIISKAPNKLMSYQTADSIYVNWESTNADFYFVSYRFKGDDDYTYISDKSGKARKMLWYPDYSLKFTGIDKNEIIEFVVTSVKNGIASTYSKPLSVTFNGSNTMPNTVSLSVKSSTYSILVSKYETNNIIMAMISSDKISKNADKNVSNQSKWLRIFEDTLASKSANSGGRANSWAVSEALKAANDSVK